MFDRIDWAAKEMPVLRSLQEEWKKTLPLLGCRISACMHVTAETANLVKVLVSAGAKVRLCASNPLSTQDDVVDGLNMLQGVLVWAKHGVDRDTYYEHMESTLRDFNPHIIMDDGSDLTTYVLKNRSDLVKSILGGTEETTTGVQRLRAMEKDGTLTFPMVAVNDSQTKNMFDNRYGTGQSTIDGILRATNRLIAGKVFVVAGYGWCGRGLANRARGMGAQVIVTEIDSVKALEAVMDGFRVMPMNEAAKLGDFFVTVTGCKDVITFEHVKQMKNGTILANSGHFDSEIDLKSFVDSHATITEVKPGVHEYFWYGAMEHKVYVLSEGRLVNLAAAEGHPADVMDMSFANQAIAVKAIWEKKYGTEGKVHKLDKEVDSEIASLKLRSMGLEIDRLTEDQMKYISSWEEGT